MSTLRSILFIFFSVCFTVQPSLFAMGMTPTPTFVKTAIKELHSPRQGTELLLRKYPELFWIPADNTEMTFHDPFDGHQSLSTALDKTLIGLFHIRHFLEGSKASYQRFVSLQEDSQKISFRQYKQIHKLFHDFIVNNPMLKPEDALRVLDTAFIIGKIGSGKKTHSVFSPFFKISDELSFYKKALTVLSKFPTLCPSFGRLPKNCQNAILDSKELLPLENPNSLESCRKLLQVVEKLSIEGDTDCSSSLRILLYFLNFSISNNETDVFSLKNYTSAVHKDFVSLFSAIQAIKTHELNAEQAFAHCFNQRAQFLGLNPLNPLGRIAIRLCSFLNIHDGREAAALQAAFEDLSDEAISVVIEKLDPVVVGWEAPLSNAATSFLASLCQKNSYSFSDLALYNTMKNGVPFLLKALSLHETMVSSQMIPEATPLKFDFAADFALSLEDLSVLESSEVQITNKGYVLVKPSEIASTTP